MTREYLENLWEIPVLVSNCIICNKEIALLSGSNEHLLLTTYRQGLKPKLRLHLDAYDDAMGLEKFVQLSIRVARCVQGCMEHQQGQQAYPLPRQPEYVSSPEPSVEHMQV